MLERITVDGQDLDLIIDPIKYIPELDNIKGLSQSIVDILKHKILKSRGSEKVKFAIGRLGNRVLPYTLYELDGSFIRIHLEEIICSNCKIIIFIGNPFVIDNWIGVDKELRQMALKEIKDKMEDCPNCSSLLSREGFIIKKNTVNSDS